jgi:hypothetical protein
MVIRKGVEMMEAISFIASGAIAIGGMIVLWLVGTAK